MNKMSNKIISSKEIEKVASLARIAISEQEKKKFAKEIGSILDFFKDLGNVNVQNFQSFDHYDLDKNQFRPDETSSSSQKEKEATRKQFPKRRGDFLEVKTVLKP